MVIFTVQMIVGRELFCFIGTMPGQMNLPKRRELLFKHLDFQKTGGYNGYH